MNIKYEIDVVMPFHKIDVFLIESIGSVLQSKSVNLRLIVVNDSNEDVSKKQLGLRDIDLLVLSRGKGYANAMATGIFLSNSDFVGFQDSDDLTDAMRLKIQLDLIKDSQSDYCSGNLIKISKDGNQININSLSGPNPGSSNIHELWVIGSYRADSTIIIKGNLIRDTWSKHLDYPEIFADYAWALSLPGGTKFIHADSAHYFYRSHPNQMSRSRHLENHWETIFPLWDRNLRELEFLSSSTGLNVSSKVGLALAFPSARVKLSRNERLVLAKIISLIKIRVKSRSRLESDAWVRCLNRRGLIATRLLNPGYWMAIPSLLKDVYNYKKIGLKPR